VRPVASFADHPLCATVRAASATVALAQLPGADGSDTLADFPSQCTSRCTPFETSTQVGSPSSPRSRCTRSDPYSRTDLHQRIRRGRRCRAASVCVPLHPCGCQSTRGLRKLHRDELGGRPLDLRIVCNSRATRHLFRAWVQHIARAPRHKSASLVCARQCRSGSAHRNLERRSDRLANRRILTLGRDLDCTLDKSYGGRRDRRLARVPRQRRVWSVLLFGCPCVSDTGCSRQRGEFERQDGVAGDARWCPGRRCARFLSPPLSFPLLFPSVTPGFSLR
jgi:hypothetical protein